MNIVEALDILQRRLTEGELERITLVTDTFSSEERREHIKKFRPYGPWSWPGIELYTGDARLAVDLDQITDELFGGGGRKWIGVAS